MRFFFYGTLLDHGVRRAVLGTLADRLKIEPAVLRGWRRVRLRGRQYPVVVPCAGGAVEGCVVDGLPASAIARLNRFEGSEYSLIETKITDASGTVLAAHLFVGNRRAAPTAAAWDFDEWKRKRRAAFLRRLRRPIAPKE